MTPSPTFAKKQPNKIQQIYGNSLYTIKTRSPTQKEWQEQFVYRWNNPRGPKWYQTTSSNHFVQLFLPPTLEEVEGDCKEDRKGKGGLLVWIGVGGRSIKGGDVVIRPGGRKGISLCDGDEKGKEKGKGGEVVLRVWERSQWWIDIKGMGEDPLLLFVNFDERLDGFVDRVRKEVWGGKLMTRGVWRVDVEIWMDYQKVFERVKMGLGEEDCLVLVVFKKGVHFVGRVVEGMRKRDLIVYLERGSVVVGGVVDSDWKRVVIGGWGVIDGGGGHLKEYWPRDEKEQRVRFDKPGNVEGGWESHDNVLEIRGKGQQVRVEGIVLLSVRGFLIDCFMNDSVYDNVKCMGWSYNSDGVSVYRNAVVRNSFFKVNDDCIKLGSGLVENCVIWHQHNAHVFVARVWSKARLDNVVVKNIDIVKVEQGNGGSVFAIRGKPGASFSNWRFENIRIESNVDRLMDFAPTREYFPDKPLQTQESQDRTVLENFVFKNIRWNGRSKRCSWFRCGMKGEIRDVVFEDFVANGNPLTSIEDLSEANGFSKGFTGFGNIHDISFVVDGKEVRKHKSVSDELGAWRTTTDCGEVRAFCIDSKLPDASFRDDKCDAR